MSAVKIALHDLLPQGVSVHVDDPAVWSAPWAEFGIACRAVEPLVADVTLLPQDGGVLVQGRLTGMVALPCDRCTEDAIVRIDQQFDEFEEYSGDDSDPDEEDALPSGELILLENGRPVLDLAALLWEEFSLALPVKPLCSPSCRGVCPVCGKNLNEGPCACVPDSGDPRLAALRNIKVQ